MRLLGLFKVVPDLDFIAEEDWMADERLQVDTSYAKLSWNCFDEGMLEMMLKLSDLSEGFDVVYELSALTVGKSRHETFLKNLYALGFCHGVRVDVGEEADLRFCPGRIAGAVVNYVREKAPQDVILTGVQSADGNNMKMPLLLAEKLKWPCITQVAALEPVDENHLKVISQEDEGMVIQIVKVPCVLAVGNASCSYLRVPTLREKMGRGKRPVEQISFDWDSQENREENVELTELRPVSRSRSTVLIGGDTPEEKARKLYETYLKERLERL